MKYLLTIGLLLLSVTSFAASFTVDIKGMTCGMCVKAITGELEKTGKLEKVNVSLEEKKAYFAEKKGEKISDAEVKSAIKKAGYSATSIVRQK